MYLRLAVVVGFLLCLLSVSLCNNGVGGPPVFPPGFPTPNAQAQTQAQTPVNSVSVSVKDSVPRQLQSSMQYTFQVIDAMPRKQIFGYVQELLLRTCAVNDILVESGLTKSVNSNAARPFISGHQSRMGVDVAGLLDRLSASDITIRNLSYLMALIYIDRVSESIRVYPSSKTLRKLLGASIIVASRLHNDEVSAEELCAALGLDLDELKEAEVGLVSAVNDLSIHPHTFHSYVRAIVDGWGGEVGNANRNTKNINMNVNMKNTALSSFSLCTPTTSPPPPPDQPFNC